MFRRSPPRAIQCGGIAVNSQYPASRSYYVGGEQRHVAHARAEIQNPHTRNHPGRPEELLRVRSQNASLQHQPFIFMDGLAENVIGRDRRPHRAII